MGTNVTPSTCTSPKGMRGTGVIAVLLAMAVPLAAAGCSSDSKSSSATVREAATAATAAATGSVTGAAGGLPGSAADIALTGGAAVADAGNVTLADASPFGTALAITASVSVQVTDVRAAVNDLPALVEAKGGAIFDTDVTVGDPATAAAMITVKIRPQELESLIAGLGGLGELTGRTQQTEDVADQLADTQSRIATAQRSVDRVRVLLDTAVDLDAVITIENELTIRETALEQLLATQRNVTDRVQLATLTIMIRAVPVIARPTTHATTVGGAFRSGWRGFVRVLHGIAVAVAYLAPLLALGFVASIGVLVVHRLRRSRRRVTTPAPAE